MLPSGKEDGADTERNASIAPSQEAPQHSQDLTPNSFQSFLSTLRKLLTKAQKRMSLNNQAKVRKTNIFNENSHQHGTIRKASLVLLRERKERTALQISLKKGGSVWSVNGIKCRLVNCAKPISTKSALDWRLQMMKNSFVLFVKSNLVCFVASFLRSAFYAFGLILNFPFFK
jgi:hypothetical protein